MKSTYVSITSCFDYNIPINKQIQYISQNGFSNFSLGENYRHSGIFDKTSIFRLKKILNLYNVKIDTIHFSSTLDNDNWYDIMSKTMLSATYLNVPTIVAHCTSFMLSDNNYNYSLKKLEKNITILEKLCYTHHKKIALENLSPGNATNIVEKLLEKSDPTLIGFCYDSSHDQIDGPRPLHLLNRWKHRLFTVHISDRIGPFVDHVIPGEGFIDFNEFVEIMKTLNFEFPLLFEVETTHSRYKSQKVFLKETFKAASNILNRINSI